MPSETSVPLDCLVLGDTSRAVGASQERVVAAALLVSSSISTFLGLFA